MMALQLESLFPEVGVEAENAWRETMRLLAED